MKAELQKKLMEKHRALFRYYYEPTKPLMPMAFGLECGSGWYKILDEAFEGLSKIDGLVLTQVKEKFGGLRIYLSGGDDAADEIVEKAERKSYETCEVCGEPGVERPGGWIMTLCDRHYAMKPIRDIPESEWFDPDR